MQSGNLGERSHTAADFAALLGAICLALANWACFAGAGNLPPWKAWISVAIAVVLALASLTRHPVWEARLKILAAGWMFASPWLLGFAWIGAAVWAHSAIGSAMLVALAPKLLAQQHLAADGMQPVPAQTQ